MITLLACNFPSIRYPPTATPSPLPTATVLPPTESFTATPGLPFDDAGPLFAGLCFKFLQTLSGQTLVLDTPDDLNALYDRVDQSKLCRDPAARQSFDFSARQIVGTVLTGQGCTLDISYLGDHLDDTTHQRIVLLSAVIGGDCEYDLVRPLWLAIERPPEGYTTAIRFGS